MPLVVNLQRKLKLETKLYRAFCESLLSAVEEANDSDFSVALVSDSRMMELNLFFRDKESTTDVLSFPHQEDEFESSSHAFTADGFTPEGAARTFLGDIVISVEQAERQAKENKLSLEREIKQLLLHGLLHLCGYDHETDDGEMNKRELELRRKLKI